MEFRMELEEIFREFVSMKDNLWMVKKMVGVEKSMQMELTTLDGGKMVNIMEMGKSLIP
jgi:hypothetical protein